MGGNLCSSFPEEKTWNMSLAFFWCWCKISTVKSTCCKHEGTPAGGRGSLAAHHQREKSFPENVHLQGVWTAIKRTIRQGKKAQAAVTPGSSWPGHPPATRANRPHRRKRRERARPVRAGGGRGVWAEHAHEPVF